MESARHRQYSIKEKEDREFGKSKGAGMKQATSEKSLRSLFSLAQTYQKESVAKLTWPN